MMTMGWVLLMLRIGTVVHHHEVDKAQVRFGLSMLLIMLDQIEQPVRLVDAKAGEQTASQQLAGQQESNERLHNFLSISS